jgi:hypothetical protein
MAKKKKECQLVEKRGKMEEGKEEGIKQREGEKREKDGEFI